MSDTKSDVTDNKPEDEPQVGTEEQTGESAQGGKPEDEAGDKSKESDQPEGSDEDDEDEGGDELPDWARKKLSKANKEAANFRTQLRELQQKLEGAKTPEEVAAITNELTESNTTLTLDLARERALRKHGLEEDDLVLLTASSPEEIDKQAERIASRIGGGESSSLRGGLDPTDDDTDSSDPGVLAKKYGRRRR